LFIAGAGNLNSALQSIAVFPAGMRAAHLLTVSNLAAKLLSQCPELNIAQLRQFILDSADLKPAGAQLAIPVRLLNPARSTQLAGLIHKTAAR